MWNSSYPDLPVHTAYTNVHISKPYCKSILNCISFLNNTLKLFNMYGNVSLNWTTGTEMSLRLLSHVQCLVHLKSNPGGFSPLGVVCLCRWKRSKSHSSTDQNNRFEAFWARSGFKRTLAWTRNQSSCRNWAKHALYFASWVAFFCRCKSHEAQTKPTDRAEVP